MSDFERTFGAGANLDSIIDGLSYVPRSSDFDTSEIIFYDSNDALEFIKKNSGLCLEVASETYEEYNIFGADFDEDPPKTILARDVYKVSRLREGQYIRVAGNIEEKYSCRAIPQVFTLVVPYDPNQAAWMNCHFDSRLSHKIENNEITLESIGDYFSGMGCSQRVALTRAPHDLVEIVSVLNSKNMELIPISESVSLIISGGESVDAALVTEGGCTYLVQYGFSDRIYNMLV
ncbi:hypothetical protein RDI61_17775 [Pseudomonas plecoglossicida]|uniref:hypothetical protein n=1 Tax=Pseudomonas putida group TaxID=136845 RepID=UPI002410379C|nr:MULTISPECIES: hypothetical protein [Pseudomonas putida group]MDQ7965877.1 hypothetical protein [Pseudomonas plecoglossicida]WFG01121.1 hypothetical protein P3X84_18525 [Pseudomonas putida]